MLRRREGAGSGKGETERGASQTRNGTRQRERGWAVWDGRCSFVRRSGSGGAESVQEKAGGSIQPLESSRDYTSQPRVPASPRAYAHAKRACRITSAPTPPLAHSFPQENAGMPCVLITRRDAAAETPLGKRTKGRELGHFRRC